MVTASFYDAASFMLLRPRTFAALGFSTWHALLFEEGLRQEVVGDLKAEMHRMLRWGAATFDLIAPTSPLSSCQTRGLLCICPAPAGAL